MLVFVKLVPEPESTKQLLIIFIFYWTTLPLPSLILICAALSLSSFSWLVITLIYSRYFISSRSFSSQRAKRKSILRRWCFVAFVMGKFVELMMLVWNYVLVAVIYDGCPKTITQGIWWPRTKFNLPAAVPCPKGSVGTNTAALKDTDYGCIGW